VALHVALLGEGLVAKVTGEWPLPAVHRIVALQVHSLGEGLRANVTHEGPHIVVHLHVTIQVPRITEALRAQLALVGGLVVVVHLLSMQRLIPLASEGLHQWIVVRLR